MSRRLPNCSGEGTGTGDEEETLITSQIQGAVGIIRLDGRFTFQDYDTFKSIIQEILDGHRITELGVDLSAATYMDSNALSMLISLREKANARNITIRLIKPSPSIQAILEMVQFEKLFLIVE